MAKNIERKITSAEKEFQKRFKPNMGAGNIVNVCGLSNRPEYYSGRGANTTDLNSEILEKVYLGIKRVKGKKAAEEYVKMIVDVPKLSATDFLLHLYNLEMSGWKWNKEMAGPGANGVYVGKKDGEYDLASGMMGIVGAMSGMNARDETRYIRGEFLRMHGIKDSDSRDSEDYGMISMSGDFFG